MKRTYLSCVVLSAVLCLASARVMAQANQSTPRTSDGHPRFERGCGLGSGLHSSTIARIHWPKSRLP